MTPIFLMLFSLLVLGLSSSPLGCDACRLAVDLMKPVLEGVGKVENTLRPVCERVADPSICNVLLSHSALDAALTMSSGQVCTHIGVCRRVSVGSKPSIQKPRVPKASPHPVQRLDLQSLPITGESNGAITCDACKLAVDVLKPVAKYGEKMLTNLQKMCRNILAENICAKIVAPDRLEDFVQDSTDAICKRVGLCQTNMGGLPNGRPTFEVEKEARWTMSWRE